MYSILTFKSSQASHQVVTPLISVSHAITCEVLPWYESLHHQHQLCQCRRNLSWVQFGTCSLPASDMRKRKWWETTACLFHFAIAQVEPKSTSAHSLFTILNYCAINSDLHAVKEYTGCSWSICPLCNNRDRFLTEHYYIRLLELRKVKIVVFFSKSAL